TAVRHRFAITADPAWPTPSSRYTLLFRLRTRRGVIDTGSACGYNSHQARTAGWVLRFDRRSPAADCATGGCALGTGGVVLLTTRPLSSTRSPAPRSSVLGRREITSTVPSRSKRRIAREVSVPCPR